MRAPCAPVLGVLALVALPWMVGCGGERGPGTAVPGRGVLPPVRAGTLEVSRVVMAEPVTGERTALYFDVANTGAAPDTLTGVDAGPLGRASVHRTTEVGGVSRMRAAGPVEIAAAGGIELRPGGLHVMVEELEHAPVAGDTVAVTLHFAVAGPVGVRARVVSYADLQEVLGPSG